MAGGGGEAFEVVRARVPRVRPNWWVILAVSFALMALLVAIAGNPPRSARVEGHADPGSAAGTALEPGRSRAPTQFGTTTHAPVSATSATAPTSPPVPAPANEPDHSAATSPELPTSGPTTSVPAPPAVTPTPVPPVITQTTTPGAAQAQPADRTQSQGVLDPPGQTSGVYAFTGTGPMQVSVVWSSPTYLTMVVACPASSQSVGGTSAMAATLSDAAGSCRATVTEPASESVALTYTITIGPAGA